MSQQAVLELTLFELSRQFRDDVHVAIQYGPMIEDQLPGDSLQLSGPLPGSSRVEYRVAGETLIRESFHGDQSVAREVYRLPECQIQFRSEAIDTQQAAVDKQPRFLVLDIDRAGLAIMPQQQPVRRKRKLAVVAELGCGARLST